MSGFKRDIRVTLKGSREHAEETYGIDVNVHRYLVIDESRNVRGFWVTLQKATAQITYLIGRFNPIETPEEKMKIRIDWMIEDTKTGALYTYEEARTGGNIVRLYG